MLRIKKEHLGKVILRGQSKFILSEDLTQQEILYVKNMISSEFVEEVKVEDKVKEIIPIIKEKIKKDDADHNQKSDK